MGAREQHKRNEPKMNVIDAMKARLDEDNGELPERWNPDDTPGQRLIGRLLRFESITTQLGVAKLAVIRSAEDDVTYGVLLGRDVLKKRFDLLDPRPGDWIGLKFHGRVHPRSGG